MKTVSLILLALMFGMGVQSQNKFFVTDTIPTSAAQNNKGDYYTFCDEITHIQKFENVAQKPTLITINKGNDALTLVIYESDEVKFEKPILELFRIGEQICVQGQVIDFQGNARIEIGNPRQVSWTK